MDDDNDDGWHILLLSEACIKPNRPLRSPQNLPVVMVAVEVPVVDVLLHGMAAPLVELRPRNSTRKNNPACIIVFILLFTAVVIIIVARVVVVAAKLLVGMSDFLLLV